MKAIIINYNNMTIGGIENYLYKYVSAAIKSNIRVFWLYNKHFQLSPEYENIFQSELVTKIEFNNKAWNWCKINTNVDFEQFDEINVVSCSFLDYLRMNTLQSKLKNVKINNIYALAHYKSKQYYPEETEDISNKDKLFEYTKSVFQKMLANNELRGFNIAHINTAIGKYQLKIDNKEDLVLKSPETPIPFDENSAREKAKREEFRIIAVSRFEFPHKAYVLGLIDDFCRLAKKYPTLKLYIVGHGANQDQLMSKLEEVPEEIKDRVVFVGPLAPDKLAEAYKNAHLNISLSGCAELGAFNGTITLIPRHYSYNCEVYGYYFEAHDKLLSEEPGNIIDPYIDQLINCSDDEYVDIARKCYNFGASLYDSDPLYLYKIETMKKEAISKKEMSYFKKYEFRLKMRDIFHKYFKG